MYFWCVSVFVVVVNDAFFFLRAFYLCACVQEKICAVYSFHHHILLLVLLLLQMVICVDVNVCGIVLETERDVRIKMVCEFVRMCVVLKR